jgi:hypothetical protein
VGAAGGLGDHPVAAGVLPAGVLQGVDLELGVLIGGGDAGVAEQGFHAADRPTTLRQRWLCDVDFGHEFWTPERRFLVGEWWLLQKRTFLRRSGWAAFLVGPVWFGAAVACGMSEGMT